VRVERTNVAGRIVSIDEPVPNAIAENDQILVDDRRRRVRVVGLVDLPDEALAQIENAMRAEAVDELSGCRIDAEETVAAVDEDAQLVAVGTIAPRGDSAVHEAGAVGGWPSSWALGSKAHNSRAIGVQRHDGCRAC
jgi:hypothetical protein